MTKIAYLSPRQLAELIGVPVSTIYGFNSDGSAPRRFRIGKHIRYRVTDVQAWLDKHAVEDGRGAA